jgi:light-regulated signal transduction histidine kinase (bacteriophytochrome)
VPRGEDDESIIAGRGSAYEEAGGRIVVAGVFVDVTERRRVEGRLQLYADELAQSNAELQHFAYVASHDLQEPLRMVRSFTEMLGKRYADKLDDDAHEFIGFAMEGAERMQRLINDLLSYSRVGSRGGDRAPTDANLIVERAMSNLAALIAETGAVVITADLPVVDCEASQVVRVFQNLMANAMKFRGADSPEIHVSARVDEKETVFSIRDNGIGIPDDCFDRIFVIFQRLHSRAEYDGTGIGLAICRKVIERHRGRIWVESRVGEGTTFHFTLPNGESER